MAKLFLPQATLEDWALGDKADLKDGKLWITEDKVSFSVTPAVHFTKLVSGSDEAKLVSKVKTQEQMSSLGAEQIMESVIIGNSAYEVIPGYLAEVPVPKRKPEDPPLAPEADLLAAFLLDKL